MTPLPHRLYLAIVALAAWTVVVAVGCDDETPAPDAVARTWTYESANAPFAVQLPAEWKMEDPERLNKYADLAASYGGEETGALYLIVIPQRLPELEGVAPPDALSLKRASVAVMEEEIADFEVVRQGPVRVADQEGQTVFARGVVEGRPVSYVTTYLTHGGWGFQVVAWGPREREQAVVAHVDHLLNRWRFTAPANPSPTQNIERAETPGVGAEAEPAPGAAPADEGPDADASP